VHSVPPNVYQVIQRGCDYLGVKMKHVLSKTKTDSLVEARFILIHLIKFNPHFRFSLNEIAKIFNKNDHTSVVHAIKKIKVYYEVDERFKKKLEGAHYFIYGSLQFLVI
jgi:hypothetical protein